MPIMPDTHLVDFMRMRRVEIMERIDTASKRAGHSSSEICLEAISKTVDVDAVAAAIEVGYTAFGENRPQELARKIAAFEDAGIQPPRFDMIGNLQTNKINAVLGKSELIHSVTSLHLAEAISKRAERTQTPANVLLECNISGELSKSGFSSDEIWHQVDDLLNLKGIAIQGLMTMAPLGDLSAARATFSGLRELAEQLRVRTGLGLEVLSCGMSDDFEIAIEEGSTLVRLGRVVFSEEYSLD